MRTKIWTLLTLIKMSNKKKKFNLIYKILKLKIIWIFQKIKI